MLATQLVAACFSQQEGGTISQFVFGSAFLFAIFDPYTPGTEEYIEHNIYSVISCWPRQYLYTGKHNRQRRGHGSKYAA
jgi:hypothetical protein